MKPKSTLRSFLLLVGSSLLAVSSASATEYWWDSNNNTAGFGTTNGTWAAPTLGTTTAGWSTDSLGTTATNGVDVTTTNADDLNFGTATLGYTGNRTITVSAGMVASSLQLGAGQGANSLTLSGGSITMGGSGTRTGILINAGVSGSGSPLTALSITSNVALNGAQNWTNNATGIMVLSNSTAGALTGSADLSINGTGRISIVGLAGATDYSGNITISGGGELESRTNITTNGALGTGNINVNGGTLGLYFNNTLTRAIGTGAGQIQFSGGVSGISGNGATGSTFTLSGMTWGSTAFNPTQFIFQNATSNTNGAGTLAGNIDLGGATRTIRSNQTGGLATGGTGTFSGNISNGGITKVGVGTHVFGGTNSYADGTNINEGVLRFNTRTSMPASGTVSVASGAILSVTVAGSGTTWGGGTGVAGIAGLTSTANSGGGFGGQSGAVINFAGDSSLNLNLTANTVESNAITNGGATNLSLIVSRTGNVVGMLTLSGANTYTGGTSVLAGSTLAFANGSLGSTGTINASGGTLMWLPGNTQDISSRLAMTASTTSTFNTNGNDVTFANAIGSSTSGALAKAGLGTLTLQGQNTYTGGTTVSAGTLTLESGASTITQTLGGNLSFNTAEGTLASNKSGAGDILTTFGGFSRSAGAAGNIVSTGGTYGTDNRVNITGTAGFLDKGIYFGGSEFAARNGGTGGLARALVYGSDTNAEAVDTITSGRHVKLTSTPGSQAAIALLSLNLQGSGVSWSSSGALTVPGILKSGGGSASTISGSTLLAGSTHTELVIRTDTTADSLTISSDITGGSSGTATNAHLTKSGAGTLSLSGTNTYAGFTYVTAGLLKLDSSTAMPGGITNGTGTNRVILNGGVIGLTAASGNFTRSLGSGVATNITINNAGGGFAAFGVDRTVNFGGAGAVFNWNASNGSGWGNSGGALMILSHADSDAKIIMANAINLSDNVSNVTQIVRVENGSAAIDAEFSGVVGNGVGGSTNNGLTKTGAGALLLSNTNTYTGATTVRGGTLVITANQATSAITVEAGAKVGLDISTSVTASSATITLGGSVQVTGSPTLSSYTLLTASSITGTPVLSPAIPGYTLVIDGGNTLKLNATGGGDVTPPTLTSIVDDKSGGPVTVGTLVTYTVTFNEDIDAASVSAADFDNEGTAAVTIGSVTETAPTSGVFTVQATPTTTGTLKLRIPTGAVVEDVALNDLVVPVSDDTTITVQTAYEAWSGAADFNADSNGDGVKNGLAFLLGAANKNVSALNLLPTVTQSGGNLLLNFNCLPVSARGSASLKVTHSNNLVSWTTTTNVVPDATNAVPDNNVTFVVGAGPVGPPALNSVTATIGSAAAAGGKLFGRLEAVNP